MKKIILYLLLLTIAAGASAQEGKYKLEEARYYIKRSDIDNAVIYYAQCVDKAKETRNAGMGVSGELLAEYAYALALHHDFEAALTNIDRAIMLKASNGEFLAGQILILMGYGTAAFQLSGMEPKQKHNIPRYSRWINGIYQNLQDAYATKATINRDSPQNALKHAAALAGREQTVQAIALYEELMNQYPNAYIIPTSYSTLWENLGNRVYAATLLKKGIDLMGTDTSGKAAFTEHLKKLDAVQPLGWSKLTQGLRTIVYTGASFSKGMTSLNGRVGVSNESKLSLSLNANVMFWEKTAFGSVGLSAYKTWSFFVIGLGVSRQISKTSKAWGLAPSLGLTFINKTQTASFDITAAGQIPFASETKFSYSLSIGTTFYLDINQKKK